MTAEQGQPGPIVRVDQMIRIGVFMHGKELVAGTPSLLSQIDKRLGDFTATERLDALGRLLHGVAGNRNKQQREAALHLLSRIQFFPEQTVAVQEIFFEVVNEQRRKEDLNIGDIRILLAAGNILVSHFRDSAERKKIATSFLPLTERFKNPDIWQEVALGVFDIQKEINVSSIATQSVAVRRALIQLAGGRNLLTLDELRNALGEEYNLQVDRAEIKLNLRGLEKQGISLPFSK